ncbi:MAG: ABC transporter permease [Lachnospiraceae bacterium]|nr:ABC transporter permease [Lachnospiraceae bacterium]
MRNILLVLKKELYRVFSDKKLIISLFILPAVLMFGLYGLIGMLERNMSEDIETHVPVTYIVNATDGLKAAAAAAGFAQNASIDYLSEEAFLTMEGRLTEDLREGFADLIVVLDADFEDVFSAYQGQGDKIPGIQILFNSAENYSQQAYAVFSGVLETYRMMLLQERLGNLEQIVVFEQKDTEIVKEAKANSRFIATMFPYMIMIMLFSGAMSISVDAFAGEKERGTLASMLIAPVKRTDIAAGKVIALAIIAALSSVVYAVSMILAMTMMGNAMGGEGGFGGVSFSAGQILELGLMLIVVDYLFVAVIAVLSSVSKDVKSASTLVTPVYMVVLACALMTMFSGGAKNSLTRYAIPLYGNALALQDICTGELSAAGFLVSFGVTALLAAALTALLARIFDSDKLMFNA